jgi:methyl-accepting chemotaxis protein
MTVSQGVTTIAICMIILTVAGSAAAVALIYGILTIKSVIKNKIDEAMAKIEPVVEQAKSIAEQARHTAESVSAKVEAIAAKAEDTANKVGDKVQSVSEKVENAINPQIVTAAGIVGTVARCVKIYKELRQIKCADDGKLQQTG